MQVNKIITAQPVFGIGNKGIVSGSIHLQDKVLEPGVKYSIVTTKIDERTSNKS